MSVFKNALDFLFGTTLRAKLQSSVHGRSRVLHATKAGPARRGVKKHNPPGTKLARKAMEHKMGAHH
jgi:hypothetical protein